MIFDPKVQLLASTCKILRYKKIGWVSPSCLASSVMLGGLAEHLRKWSRRTRPASAEAAPVKNSCCEAFSFSLTTTRHHNTKRYESLAWILESRAFLLKQVESSWLCTCLHCESSPQAHCWHLPRPLHIQDCRRT